MLWSSVKVPLTLYGPSAVLITPCSVATELKTSSGLVRPGFRTLLLPSRRGVRAACWFGSRYVAREPHRPLPQLRRTPMTVHSAH